MSFKIKFQKSFNLFASDELIGSLSFASYSSIMGEHPRPAHNHPDYHICQHVIPMKCSNLMPARYPLLQSTIFQVGTS